jgi:hypothetical protein
MKCASVFLVVLSLAAPARSAEAFALPDWSGAWQMMGPTVFDMATVEPKNGRAGDPGVREHPPYTPEYEAIYVKNIEAIRKGVFPDPISTCGVPHGMPRAFNVPDAYEFAVTPQQVWMITENGPGIVRIYTDGRQHPKPEDRWGTYTGDNIGRWEGDTLVIDSISMKGWTEKDEILDRTGLILSPDAHVVTRLRRTDANTMEAQITVDDPKALTRPWSVTKRYRHLPAGTRVYDYACGENNRNPISETGRTLTLGSNGKPLDKVTK